VRSFNHVNARTIDDARSLLDRYKDKAVLNAGGTDLLGVLKDEILPDYPELVINIKTIPGLDAIEEDDAGLTIGALARLSHIAGSDLIKACYPVLAEAARSVATPQIRNAATLGGNLCQDVRCWYYRYPRHIGGPIQCLRKGKGTCLAVRGDNRYHAVMEGKKCFAVCPSDTATALAALDARICTAGPEGNRSIRVTDFYSPLSKTLQPGEIVTEVRIPKMPGAVDQRFLKFTLRKPVDFALASVASGVVSEDGICRDVRIALGAAGPGPVRASRAEEALIGKPINEATAAEAADAAMAGARPLSKNGYKIEIIKTLIKRALLGGG